MFDIFGLKTGDMSQQWSLPSLPAIDQILGGLLRPAISGEF